MLSNEERNIDQLIAEIETKCPRLPLQCDKEDMNLIHVYEATSTEGSKYFRTKREARAFRVERPDLDDGSCCWLIKKRVRRDDDGYFYISTAPWGMPRMISLEPIKLDIPDERLQKKKSCESSSGESDSEDSHSEKGDIAECD